MFTPDYFCRYIVFGWSPCLQHAFSEPGVVLNGVDTVGALNANLPNLMQFFINLIVRYMKAEVVYRPSTTETVFKYRIDNTFPYAYFTLVVTSTRIRVSKFGFSYDEATNTYLTYHDLPATSGCEYDSRGSFLIVFPGFFYVASADSSSPSTLDLSKYTEKGTGVFFARDMFSPNRKNSRVTVGVVAAGDGVDITLADDMSSWGVGDQIVFWPTDASSVVKGTVVSVSGNVIKANVDDPVTTNHIGVAIPAIGLLASKNNNRTPVYSAKAGNMSIVYATDLSTVFGFAQNSDDYYNAAIGGSGRRLTGRCLVKAYNVVGCFDTGGMLSFSSDFGGSIGFNDDGSAPIPIVTTACAANAITGVFSFPENSLVGKYIRCSSGNCDGQIRRITSNNATTIGVDHWFYGSPTAISTFHIADNLYANLGSGGSESGMNFVNNKHYFKVQS